jgi:fructose-1,6-bisphosphatase II
VEIAHNDGLDLDRVLTTDDLVDSDNIFFAATGVTNGEFLKGVNYRGDDRAVTHSVVMRSKTGSIRYMDAVHNLERLRAISSLTVD